MVDREVDGQHVFFDTFFYIFDGWSIVKLTGLCAWCWVALGASECGPGPLLGLCGQWLLGAMLAILGRSWASTGGPGPPLEPL